MEPIPCELKFLTPGQLSARSGVAVSALHFYERKGLLFSERSDGNQRRYPREMLRRVAFIRASQRLGISLSRIERALEHLPIDHAPDRKDWERLSGTWKEELNERIDHLIRLRDGLSSCIGCGCLSLRNCQLANPDDVFAISASAAAPNTLCPNETLLED